jgi:acyl-CoA synthetase (AMP-forming)/AMP-acid ligase II
MLLVERFVNVSQQRPDAIAVTQNGVSTSYGALFLLAKRVANHLLSCGLSKGDRVAMLTTNSSEYAAIFYGIWITGGVTVALNTQAKARDVSNWIEHSGAKWLFIDANHPELPQVSELLNSGISTIPVFPAGDATIGSSWQTILEADSTAPDVEVNSDDIASIIYTSGTTGEPKGVTLSHGNLSANTEAILAYLNLGPDDSILNVLPFYYSYGNSVLHTHISIGARIVLENSMLYPHKIIERIAEERVTGFSGVPSTFSLLLGRVKLENYDLSSIKYVTQAGGPMPPAITDKLESTLPGANIFIMYGQTEASARLTYLPYDKLREKRGSIGIPVDGLEISILDKHGKPVNIGETGEICAKGPNIMLGYWKNSDKTDSVLIDGWLHTGDLAHFDQDHYIYIDGRSSDMIKTGGNRISPKEVEEVIQEISGVQEVAVVGVEDPLLGESIKAYVVPIPGNEIDPKSVQLYCRKNLAMYKIPKAIQFIDTLPKTSSGKVQRYKLKG